MEETKPAEGVRDYLRVYVLEGIFTSPPALCPAYMDSASWSLLPHDILDNILLLLPAASQARFRAVCKAWRLKLESKEFQDRSAALAFSSGLFLCGLVYRNGDWWQDEHMHYKSWHKVLNLSFPFLPSYFLDFLQKGYQESFFFVQSGLVALEARIPEYRICIINPVNQTWRELPCPGVSPGSRVTGISVVPEEGGGASYQVLVYEADDVTHAANGLIATYSFKNSFRSYSSSTNTWSRFMVPADLLGRHLDRQVLYGRLLRNGSAHAGSLERVPNPSFVANFRFHFAGEDGEGIWLVAAPKRYRYCGLGIWRLSGTSTRWETVAIMPDKFEALMVSPRGAYGQHEKEEKYLQAWRQYFIEDLEGGPDETESEETAVDVEPEYLDTLLVEAADLAGSIILIQAVVGRFRGPYNRYFLAYHTVQDTWAILSSDRGCTECVNHRLFQPASSMDAS